MLNERATVGWTLKYDLGNCPRCDCAVTMMVDGKNRFSVFHDCKNPYPARKWKKKDDA